MCQWRCSAFSNLCIVFDAQFVGLHVEIYWIWGAVSNKSLITPLEDFTLRHIRYVWEVLYKHVCVYCFYPHFSILVLALVCVWFTDQPSASFSVCFAVMRHNPFAAEGCCRRGSRNALQELYNPTQVSVQ